MLIIVGVFGGGLKLGTTAAASTAATTQPSSNLGVATGFAFGGGSASVAPTLGGLEKPKTTVVGFSLPTSTTATRYGYYIEIYTTHYIYYRGYKRLMIFTDKCF